MDLNKTWWGYGVKYGGILIAVGAETTQGTIHNLKSYIWKEKFTLTQVKVGAGLGGGIGAVLMLAFNSPSLSALDGAEVTGMSGKIDVGGYIVPLLERISKSGLTPDDLKIIIDGIDYIKSALEILDEDGPVIIGFDLLEIAREV